MRFENTYFSPDGRYWLGRETESGRHYASIPVTNGIVDYVEYYALTGDQYTNFLTDPTAVLDFVESCRRHERDDLLMQKPGSNRGTPM